MYVWDLHTYIPSPYRGCNLEKRREKREFAKSQTKPQVKGHKTIRAGRVETVQPVPNKPKPQVKGPEETRIVFDRDGTHPQGHVPEEQHRTCADTHDEHPTNQCSPTTSPNPESCLRMFDNMDAAQDLSDEARFDPETGEPLAADFASDETALPPPPPATPSESDSADETDKKTAHTDQASAPAAKPRSKRGDKALIRRTATKVVEIANATDEERSTLATLIGCENDVVELVVAVMGATRSSTVTIDAMLSIADATPLEAGVITANLSRTELKAVWSLCNPGGTSSLPAADVKAVILVAETVAAFDADRLASLRSIAALAGRV